MASQTLPPARYPRQLAVMVTQAQAEEVERAALNEQRSKGDVVRQRLDVGAELVAIAAEYGEPLGELVNAARLYAVRRTVSSTIDTAAARS